jgi:hypothetical protein
MITYFLTEAYTYSAFEIEAKIEIDNLSSGQPFDILIKFWNLENLRF